MSNQEPQNQEKTTEEAGVEKRRRFIKGVGIAAPVVLSLSNRSAFGEEQLPCTSKQLSGNPSDPLSGGSCVSGDPPSKFLGIPGNNRSNIAVNTGGTSTMTLANPVTTVIDKQVNATFTNSTGGRNGQKVRIVVTTEVVTKDTYKWNGTGLIYGDLTKTKTTTIIKKYTSQTATAALPDGTVVSVVNATLGGTPNIDINKKVIKGATFQVGAIAEYTGGTGGLNGSPTTAKSLNPTVLPTLPTPTWRDYTGGTTFMTAFGYGPTTPMREILGTNVSSDGSYCVTAMLNASYVPAFNYVLDVQQVKTVCNGGPFPSSYTSLSAFLRSTWLNAV